MIKILGNEKLFYLLFFMTLSGSAFLGYAFSIFFIFVFFLTKRKKYVSIYGILAFLLYLLLAICKIFQTGNVNLVSVLARFYLGVGPILVYVFYSRVRININFMIVLLSVEIIVETLLVNFVISPTLLPNYPKEVALGGFNSADVFGFQRPASIGINATVTATVLCMMLAYRELQIKMQRKRDIRVDILSFSAVIALASGTGFFLFLICLMYRFSDSLNLKNLILIFIMLFLTVIAAGSELLGESISSHFSKEYIQFIIDYKGEVYDDYLSIFSNKILGLDFHNMDPLTHGDTAWVEFMLSLGLFGIFYFSFLVIPFINKFNWCPLLIGFIGALHYGAIFNLPGQLFMAYSMVLNLNTKHYYLTKN